MPWGVWLLVALLVLGGGWMTYDGVRALTVGDYTTPSSGEYAGRLGPWADLVEKAGVAPRSAPMKVAFVVLGLVGLTAAAFVAFGLPAARWLVVGFAVATLWYLPWGTLVAVLDLVLVRFLWERLG